MLDGHKKWGSRVDKASILQELAITHIQLTRRACIDGYAGVSREYMYMY